MDELKTQTGISFNLVDEAVVKSADEEETIDVKIDSTETDDINTAKALIEEFNNIKSFLQKFSLRLDDDVTKTFYIEEDEKIIADF